MHSYANNIVIAIALFPFVAALITLPFMIYQYRKYGSIPFWKTFVCYTLVFYLICAYFMVILPLPECTVAADCGAVSVAPQLKPLLFLDDLSKAASTVALSLDPRTWVAFLRQSQVYVTLFNLLLTFPLGFYARYLFNARWWQALILGLGMSLFYEVSQLTGLFGIYDYAYRMFDVDDLIVNTAGCVLGCLAAIPVSRMLPDFKSLNAKALTKGARQATFTRRLVGFVVDMIPCGIFSTAIFMALASVMNFFQAMLVDCLTVLIFFMLVPCITKGQTLGQKVVKLRIFRMDGSPATPGRYVVRYGLLFGLLYGPIMLLDLMPASADDLPNEIVNAVFFTGYALWFLTILVRAIRSAFGHPFILLSGVISDTTVMTQDQARALQEQRADIGS